MCQYLKYWFLLVAAAMPLARSRFGTSSLSRPWLPRLRDYRGGSGTPDTDVSKAISIGIAKVNVCTELVAAFADTFANEQEEQDFRYNVPGVFTRPRVAAKKLVEEKIRLFTGL